MILERLPIQYLSHCSKWNGFRSYFIPHQIWPYFSNYVLYYYKVY